MLEVPVELAQRLHHALAAVGQFVHAAEVEVHRQRLPAGHRQRHRFEQVRVQQPAPEGPGGPPCPVRLACRPVQVDLHGAGHQALFGDRHLGRALGEGHPVHARVEAGLGPAQEILQPRHHSPCPRRHDSGPTAGARRSLTASQHLGATHPEARSPLFRTGTTVTVPGASAYPMHSGHVHPHPPSPPQPPQPYDVQPRDAISSPRTRVAASTPPPLGDRSRTRRQPAPPGAVRRRTGNPFPLPPTPRSRGPTA